MRGGLVMRARRVDPDTGEAYIVGLTPRELFGLLTTGAAFTVVIVVAGILMHNASLVAQIVPIIWISLVVYGVAMIRRNRKA